eukprot:3007706-Rhodomonas_salina.1
MANLVSSDEESGHPLEALRVVGPEVRAVPRHYLEPHARAHHAKRERYKRGRRVETQCSPLPSFARPWFCLVSDSIIFSLSGCSSTDLREKDAAFGLVDDDVLGKVLGDGVAHLPRTASAHCTSMPSLHARQCVETC